MAVHMFERSCKMRAHRRAALYPSKLILLAAGLVLRAGPAAVPQQHIAGPQNHPVAGANQPPRVTEAQRFLALRGWAPGHPIAPRASVFRSRSPTGFTRAFTPAASGASTSPAAATWQPLGPTAVETPNFGLVSGRVSALALDPSDATGNSLYVGTTGGGVWSASNAGTSTASSVVFNPLTDNVTALGGAAGASISIGALTVQPGETGVILAGTGDPNDALDSYYGAGILRSTDGGTTWELITTTSDAESGISNINASFVGEGFAGFAWSTSNPQLVVAAVAQALEGTLVGADLSSYGFQGLYYSSDSGATWHLATITDGAGELVQGPTGKIVTAGGNAATTVVWNPVRQLFVAAVRYHGYYQSADGVTWTRLASQPGSGLTSEMCPTNTGFVGSIACPIFRGAIAVNPLSGDTFAWSVDLNDQDQGIWQDQCQIVEGSCSNSMLTFAQQWNTSQLENTPPTPSCIQQGPATICDGIYNLALAAVPSQQDTLLMAGANDLWKCSLAMGCAWRNTTNSTTCISAQVGEFQHALAWSSANPQEVFLGNDSGLWRSLDAIGETGSACSAFDSTHFQNLNGSLGSLAEVQSVSPVLNTPYTLMAGLGVNGAAGVKSSIATADWPEILSGYGGPVVIDPADANAWYVNDQAGVAIYACSQLAPCTPADFGASPVVTDADVGGDGDVMSTPAPFLVDPADPSQLLIGTCRMWRGPADGSNWSSANAISPILDSPSTSGPCQGDALIESLAAIEIADGGEVIYLGTYGSVYNGANMPGHVLTATLNPSAGSPPQWFDLTLNPVVNETEAFNQYGFGISSVTIDPHDPTGDTVYATIEGMSAGSEEVSLVYRSTNGGTTWSDVGSNLPAAPANGLAVDPQNANTVYVATDTGVFYTTEVANCAQIQSNCWSVFGTGLPGAPAVALSATPIGTSPGVLVAATYGRGIWQTPLWSSTTAITAASVAPANLAFPTAAMGVASKPVQVQLMNTGRLPLTVTSIVMAGADPGDFNETDNCQIPPASAPVAAGGECTINVTFTPQIADIERTTVMIIYANVYGGQLNVDLTGTGSAALGAVTLSPNPLNYGPLEVGAISAPLPVSVTNNTTAAIAISSVEITGPFSIANNQCGTTSFAASSLCQVQIEFAPTQAGAATGMLTFTDTQGTQTVELTGTGLAPPTDGLNPGSLSFSPTRLGESSSMPVTITNTGDLPLTELSLSISSAPASQFEISNPCGSQVAAEHPGICTVTVQFTPTQLGPITGTLTVSDYTTKLDTQSIYLSGSGQQIANGLGVSPSQLNFSLPAAGQTSPPQTVTVTNSSGSAISPVSLATVGPFSVTQNSCSGDLAAGANCSASVVFQPTATGLSNGALTATSPSIAAPATVALSGVVFDFTVSFSGPSSQTVPAGQQATYTLVVTPSGASGSFTFTCGSLPEYALCLFKPSTESLGAGAQGNVEVDISTGGSATSRVEPTDRWYVTTLACGLVLMPFVLRRHSKILLRAVLAVIVAAGISSCTSSGGGGGGGGGGSGNGSTTPPGKYTIPVTVTSTGISHSVTLSLTVD